MPRRGAAHPTFGMPIGGSQPFMRLSSGFAEIVMPFFPAWLQAKGLNFRATGIVLAVPMFIRLISVPSLARLADRRSAP